MARVHPSFVWIKDCAQLRNDIEALRPNKSRFTQYDPIAPVTVRIGGQYVFFDTMANIPVPVGAFPESMLERYDHLFCGSFVDQVDKTHTGLLARHKAIYENPLLAKGILRQQEEYFYGKT